MKTIYDIQQYLKRFGTIIYLGDRAATLELMRDEVQELYRSQLMEAKDYQTAMLVLRQEIRLEKERKNKL
jgi:uncharacterized protein YqgQ